MEPKRRRYNCSFCGKSNQAVRRLIAGPGGISICDECIDLCNQIIAEEEHTSPTPQGRRRSGSPEGCRTIRWWQRLLGGKHRALMQTSNG